MPFQSEKQRRYLWANEPEIARDWTDTYGSRIQRNNGGIMDMASEGDLNHTFENYINNGNVSVPRSFQARSHSTPVNLAYITDREAGILQALKPGTPHRGPMEIPNYDDYDPTGGGYGRATSGQQMSSFEGGAKNEQSRADARALGYTPQEVRDIRGGAVDAAAMGQRGSGIGGLLGGLGRGLLSFFGGIPGKLASGIMTAKDWATKKGQNFGQGVKTFADYPTLDRWMNRNTDKYLNKPYRGHGKGYNFNEDTSVRDFQDPDLRADQMKEFRMRYPLDLRQSAEVPASEYEGMWDNRGITGAIPSNNPIGGVDQFAKEVLGLEQSAFPIGGTTHTVDELPGTLQDYYRNKIPNSITGYKYADKGLPGHSRIRVTQPNEITQQDDLSEIEGQMSKVIGPALIQMRVLEKKKGMEQHGGPKLTPNEERILNELKEKDAEETVYKSIIT